MFQLVFGRSGFGKTEFIRQKIKEKVDSGQSVILIVPEQFSFESERALYFLLGARSSMQVEVLSFSRLAHNIFREYGGINRQYVSDGGKNILMHLAINELADQLSVYKKNISGNGFIKCMTSAVSELKQYGVTPNDLLAASEKSDDIPLKNKTLELSKILTAYSAMLTRGYADSDDDLTAALELLREHDFWHDKCVFVDEFKGFTSVEIDILGSCITGAKEVWTAFCTESDSDNTDDTQLFSGIGSVVNRLKNKARENSITISSPIKLLHPYRFGNDSLAHLESQIFSLSKEKCDLDENNIVQIFGARNYYYEIEYIASTIKTLVRDDGLKYRDIAVIGRNIEDYKGPLKTVMKRYDIPIFYSVNEGVLSKPLPAFVLSLLRAAVKNYDNDAIFAALKTGLTPLSTEQISIAENYIFTWNIKGRMWEVPFVQNPRGFIPEFTEEDIEELDTVNLVRDYVYSAINTLRIATDGCNGDGFVKAVYETIEWLGIPERYTEIIKNTYDENRANAYKRVWEVVCDTLEEMGQILKNTVLTLQKFAELLEIMLETLDIGDIPQTLDQVLVGDASLVRPNSPSVVFAIGVNEGVFPMIPESAGIFSDSERRELMDLGVTLADATDKKIIDEQFIAYKTLTSASDRLYISYSSYDLKGTPLCESSIIEEIKKIIPSAIHTHDEEIAADFYCQNYDSSYHTLARNYRRDTPIRAALVEYFADNDDYSAGLAELERASQKTVFKIDDHDLSKKLFGSYMKLSPSKVEQYHKCSFAYFLESGLKLKKKKKAELNFLEIGSLIHYALQYLLQKHGGKGLISLSDEDIKSEVLKILSEYLETYMGGRKDKTKRFKYLYTRLANTLTKLIVQLAAEFAQSEFEPVDFELKVGSDGEIPPIELMLPTGGNIRVEGVIDRVDVMSRGKHKYIRIIDYKTGSKEFKLSDVYYGINMQMLIYLFSIWQNGYRRYGNVVPAGILYMPANTKPVTSDRNTPDEELAKKSIETFKMNGLILDDPDIIKGMDKSAKGIFINAKLDKNGKPSKKDTVASLAQLGKLKSYTQRLLVQMADELRGGKIGANPSKDGDFSACTYCNFQSICGHEETDGFMTLDTMNKDEFFENIDGGEQDGQVDN